MNENEDTLDLSYLFDILKKHFIAILIAGIFCCGAAFALSSFVIEKKYTSRAVLYVENNQQSSESVNINDINAAQKLVNTCQIIFKSSSVMDKLIENLDLPYTKEQLNEMITASAINSTEVMELVVETNDPRLSQEIVNELLKLSKEEFNRIIKSGSIETVDYGEVSTKPSFPNVTLFTAAGFVLGVVICYIIVFIRDMSDVSVKKEDNIAQIYEVPIFAEIADFETYSDEKYGYGSKYGYGGYGYGYGHRPKQEGEKKPQMINSSQSKHILTDDSPFVITEAYKAARTNIMFAIAPLNRKIIAVTSCNPSEGKSSTTINLAISFAKAGNRVLLVECDLRKPAISKYFNIRYSGSGLSSILGGFCQMDEAVRRLSIDNLDFIAAGDIPPNPSELLGSEAMKNFLHESSERYDYVFLDTPPVNVVTDSQLMNDLIAGLVFVVKEGSTTHPDIQMALEKIKLANGKALGFVKTFCHLEKSGRYGRYGKSRKYGYSYDYKYGYSNREGGDSHSKSGSSEGKVGQRGISSDEPQHSAASGTRTKQS